MERNWNMSEVSDGKLYSINDMAKIGCNDCKGCSACCHNMGNSIVLDPYDVYRLTKGLGCTFQELLGSGAAELGVVDGMILPSLKMQDDTGSCTFLSEEGRCKIHEHRPGICRMFPLGRIYEDGSFQYFNQVHECQMEPKTKVKIKQWLSTPNVKAYEEFIANWHYYLKPYQEGALQGKYGEEELKKISMQILVQFYMTPYDMDRDFYEQYEARKTLATC